MTLIVLGPLHLPRTPLVTPWGEVDDLLHGSTEYLEMTKYATLGSWLINISGNIKHTVKPLISSVTGLTAGSCRNHSITPI